MTVRFASAGCVALLALVCAMPAHAGCPVARVIYEISRDWRRNNCWPEPFVYPDRQFARAPFATMVHNGWRRQNLLGDFHFEQDTGRLTPAGQEKLRWILLEAPEHHRTVYVSRARNAEETTTRITAVHKSAGQIVPDGAPASVVETNIKPYGWPAERVDAIGRKFHDSTPEPRLPAMTDSGIQ